jgi:hypothetical protein
VPAPAAADGARTDRTDRRFRVRWGERGLCGPGDAQRVERRAQLLATFVALEASGTRVYHAPEVDPVVLDVVRSVLGTVRSPTASPLRPTFGAQLDRIPPPEVYVYRDVQQLLDVSCVNRAALGYYDGAIHLSGDLRHGVQSLAQTVIHESVHHVLLQLGVAVPMWLHEGLAMELAGETWWAEPSLGLVPWLQGQHLPFEALAGAFPHTADETFAMAAYYQSLVMVGFFRERQGDAGIPTLVGALARGELVAKEAFASTGLSGAALEEAWRGFVARRTRSRDAPMQRLLEAAERDRH